MWSSTKRVFLVLIRRQVDYVTVDRVRLNGFYQIGRLFTQFFKDIFVIWTVSHLSPSIKILVKEDRMHCSVLLSLLSLQNTRSTNAIIQRIHITLRTLSSIQLPVTFTWILSLIDLLNHDKVDQVAENFTLLPTIADSLPSPTHDLGSYYRILAT